MQHVWSWIDAIPAGRFFLLFALIFGVVGLLESRARKREQKAPLDYPAGGQEGPWF